jgi:hypothetical protein
MELIFEAFEALIIVGIPVFSFSFLMVYFSYKKGYLSTEVSIKNAFKNDDKSSSKLSKANKKNLQFFHSKWVTFGGGFYGLIAVLTFIIIELLQIINFWLSVTSLKDVTDLFSISSFVSMIVDSFINMITAAIWFTYWPNKLPSSLFIMWVLIAYIGYRIGAKHAYRFYLSKKAFEESIPNSSEV